MKLSITILHLLLFSTIATAQIGSDYRVEKRDSGFVLIQNGRAVPFDTVQVKQNLADKTDEAVVLDTEIGLLERLVMLRRQLALVREEKRTLSDIIEKARRCDQLTEN